MSISDLQASRCVLRGGKMQKIAGKSTAKLSFHIAVSRVSRIACIAAHK